MSGDVSAYLSGDVSGTVSALTNVTATCPFWRLLTNVSTGCSQRDRHVIDWSFLRTGHEHVPDTLVRAMA